MKHDGKDEERFTVRERQALDLWCAPEPPPQLVARVVAELEADRVGVRGLRQMAVAALAVVLVGGWCAARLMSGGASSSTWGEAHRVLEGDGGSAVEASPIADRVRS